MAHDKLRILLVEDDTMLAEITGFRLELLGYDVQSATSAEEALGLLGASLPDVVILDLAINGNKGIELLNRLSNDQRTSHMPVLVFSTSSDLNDVQRAYAAGAQDFLVTPYDPANLEEKVEKLIAGEV